jgi:hypothetical protein
MRLENGQGAVFSEEAETEGFQELWSGPEVSCMNVELLLAVPKGVMSKKIVRELYDSHVGCNSQLPQHLPLSSVISLSPSLTVMLTRSLMHANEGSRHRALICGH